MLEAGLLFEYSLRLGVAALLGAALGVQRETEGHAAGPRTYALVTLGAALYTIVGESYGENGARLAAQIVTGIGFLGAGTIMRQGNAIRGLTTAASLWASAGIGLACGRGGGWLALAAVASSIVLLLLGVGKVLERRLLHGAHVRDLQFDAASSTSLGDAVEAIQDAGATVERLHQTRLSPDSWHVAMRVVFSSQGEETGALNRLHALSGVSGITMRVARRTGDSSP